MTEIIKKDNRTDVVSNVVNNPQPTPQASNPKPQQVTSNNEIITLNNGNNLNKK